MNQIITTLTLAVSLFYVNKCPGQKINDSNINTLSCNLKDILVDPSNTFHVRSLFAFGDMDTVNKINTTSLKKITIDNYSNFFKVSNYMISRNYNFQTCQIRHNNKNYLYFKLLNNKPIIMEIKGKYVLTFLGNSPFSKQFDTKVYFELRNEHCHIYFSLLNFNKNRISITQYDNN